MARKKKTTARLGRKKDAPSKAEKPDLLEDVIVQCIYGKFYNSELLRWISAASLMTADAESTWRNAASSQKDPDLKNSYLANADLVRDSRSDLEQNVTQILVQALLRGDAKIFEDVAAIINKCYRRNGAETFDLVRSKLLIKYERLCLQLRRPPTLSELRSSDQPPYPPDETFERMNQAQFSRMIGARDMNLVCTPAPMINALRGIPRTSAGLPDVKLVREALRRSEGAKHAFEGNDHELLCFAETVGLEFDPDASIRANHHCLTVRKKAPPTIEELVNHLKQYVFTRLKIKSDRSLKSVCQRLGLVLVTSQKAV